MNDNPSNDPVLQSLEAKLAAIPPRVSERERQQMLYACAFAAGKKSAAAGVRRWQAACVTLAATLLGLSLMLTHSRPGTIANHPAAPAPSSLQPPEANESLKLRFVSLRLDAWRRADDSSEQFAAELARFRQTEPGLRSLAVGALGHLAATDP
jgi:hypothetical protein